MRFLPALLLTALIAATPLAAQEAAPPAPKMGGEVLLLSPPPGWVLAFSDRNARANTAAYVPAGQTGVNWSEMLTVQVFLGTANARPVEFLDFVKANTEKNCDAVGAGQTAQPEVNRYPAAVRVIACTKTKREGRGEVSMYLVIAGRESLYVVQRSWRGEAFTANAVPVSQDMLMEWGAYLNQVRLCDRTDPERACPGQS